MTLELEASKLPRGEETELGFRIVGDDGEPVRDFDVEHTKQMHLIVVRRDMAGFQHLHPEMDDSGRWSTPIEIPEAGSYRVFADFGRDDESTTLAADLAVDGETTWRTLPEDAPTTTTAGGYEVTLAGEESVVGQASDVEFSVTRNGQPIEVEPYLGADGHLVALREGDLAFLHTHPSEHEAGHGHEEAIQFTTEYPTAGRYRLFLQFKHGGEVQTAEFTRTVGR
jgi:hypothetical protein